MNVNMIHMNMISYDDFMESYMIYDLWYNRVLTSTRNG